MHGLPADGAPLFVVCHCSGCCIMQFGNNRSCSNDKERSLSVCSCEKKLLSFDCALVKWRMQVNYHYQLNELLLLMLPACRQLEQFLFVSPWCLLCKLLAMVSEPLLFVHLRSRSLQMHSRSTRWTGLLGRPDPDLRYTFPRMH